MSKFLLFRGGFYFTGGFYFAMEGIRGIIVNNVERQGKGPNNSALSPIIQKKLFWVPRITYRQEKQLSKLKIFKNHPYLTLFSLDGCFSQKKRQIWVFFENFEF